MSQYAQSCIEIETAVSFMASTKCNQHHFMIKYTGGCSFRLCVGSILLMCSRFLSGWAPSKQNEPLIVMQKNLTTDFLNCLRALRRKFLQHYAYRAGTNCLLPLNASALCGTHVSACWHMLYGDSDGYSSPQVASFLVSRLCSCSAAFFMGMMHAFLQFMQPDGRMRSVTACVAHTIIHNVSVAALLYVVYGNMINKTKTEQEYRA